MQKLNHEMMEYMVWVVEITAAAFFAGDKTLAYNNLKSSGLWDIYVDNYDTTHTLGREYLIDEMREYFVANGVLFA